MSEAPLPHAARTAARLAAVQALYQMELAGTDANVVLEQFAERATGENFEDGQCGAADQIFLNRIVNGTVKRQRKLDPAIDAALDPSWPMPRLDSTLRAILRAAAYEIMFRPDVDARTVISEYVELARAFFGGAEPGLVNGVLNRLARDHRPKEFQ
jgi:transcription antitermination protein NusB